MKDLLLSLLIWAFIIAACIVVAVLYYGAIVYIILWLLQMFGVI